jgi:thioredoxin reductase (NADPH)
LSSVVLLLVSVSSRSGVLNRSAIRNPHSALKPVILAVDDDPDVLNAIERDLRSQFRAQYRVMKAESGGEALDTIQQLKRRGLAVALFIVDEKMPQMTGTDLLRRALDVYPDARRVLLTAYAEPEAAIRGINEIRLDHYLMKPWEPPEEKLYPVLDGLLAEWSENYRPPFSGTRVLGTPLSPASFAVKDFLSRNQVPYQWEDIDTNPASRSTAEALSPGLARLPVVLFPDGTSAVQPSTRDIAERLGMQTRAQLPLYDLIVLGGGPAGLGAAVYASSEGLRTLLVEPHAPGGQAGTSSRIENYLGFPRGLSGTDLAQRAVTQARRFGTEMLTAQHAVGISREDPYRVVKLSDGSELRSFAVLVAPGMTVRELGVPGAAKLNGAGVYYGAALTEAKLYCDQHVIVVGGGNSAGQGASFLSRFASEVTIVVRRGGVDETMSRYLIDRLAETANVEILPNARVTAVHGDRRLEAVTLSDVTSGKETRLPAAAMFIFIGTAPHTDMVAGFLERNEKGFILTGPDLVSGGRRPPGWTLQRDPFFFETSVPGVFAAGDARHGSKKRVAAAVGEGSATVSMIHEYLSSV